MSNKIEAKNGRYHGGEHKKCNKIVVKMIRRIKTLSRADKKALLLDLTFANGDLMHYLSNCPQFPNVEDYFNSIKAYLELEQAAHQYPKGVELVYLPGMMQKLMEVIRLNNNANDRYEELRKKIIG